ncbi:MAG TPA: hypothetical protein VJ346_02175 [Bacteroidales bacterium]|nr:hypothetical protein [Bacteroidales bacterium]
MNRTRHILLSITLLIMTSAATNMFSQETPVKPSLDKGSIESSFSYVIKNASDFEDSKVVKSWWLWRLRSHVLDSLKVYRDSIQYIQNIVETKDHQIDSMKTDLKELTSSLSAAVKTKDTLSFLGIGMTKLAYNTIMWLLAAVLFTAFVIVFLMYKRSNIVAVRMKATLDETQEEFEAHRKRALEREQKIAREMYDEIIKYKSKYGEL